MLGELWLDCDIFGLDVEANKALRTLPVDFGNMPDSAFGISLLVGGG